VLEYRHRHRFARIWLSLLVLARVLALVLGVQLSGAAHIAADVVSLVQSGVVEHDDECPVDGACDDCPPGCPRCHCQNHLPVVVPEAVSLQVETQARPAVATLDVEAQVLLGPELPSVFRPPRASDPV